MQLLFTSLLLQTRFSPKIIVLVYDTNNAAAFVFSLYEDRDSTFLRNVGSHPKRYTTSLVDIYRLEIFKLHS
jgi:hypothetical protein